MPHYRKSRFIFPQALNYAALRSDAVGALDAAAASWTMGSEEDGPTLQPVGVR
jgi:hypothetical protein